jgi:WSC domain
MTCDGNANEYCGGPDRLDYYTGKASTPTTTAGGGGGGGTSTGPTSTPTVSGNDGATLPAGWKYDGCWVDNLDGRIMRYQQPDNAELTVESCINTCIGLGYTVAGMEYGVQCFCDTMISNGGALAANQGDCSVPCPGNANEMCGAGNRLNVFNTGTLTTVGIPVEQTGGISSWTYRGCRT